MTSYVNVPALIREQDSEYDPLPELRSALDPNGPTVLTPDEFADVADQVRAQHWAYVEWRFERGAYTDEWLAAQSPNTEVI